ncbi:MAG: MFS transporter [Betaproteobacteria bacterium]|nr:MFS transporter [Betaproteobacteria bacterium]
MTSIHRNVAVLAACQAMLFSVSATLIVVNSLAGLALAPLASLATLPVTFWVIGGAIAVVPASHLQARIGRSAGLSVGAAIGVAACLVCAMAIYIQSFWLLCAATLVFGGSNAFGQFYRFAAADAAHVDFKAKAISLVLAGGLVGGIIGPTISRVTVDVVSPRFLGAYLTIVVYLLVTILLLRGLKLPTPTEAERAKKGRPLAEIAAQPKFLVAVACGAIGFGVMNFLMTATPIAMGVCGHPYGDAAFVISSHVIGMFAPSFFTGSLIKRFGVIAVLFAGALLNIVAVGSALAGISVSHFWFSLVVLGMGWNFLYIGGTTLLTETYRPEERAKVQGVNDLAVFVMMTLASFTSGLTVTTAGWDKVNFSALPLIALVLAAITWLALHERAARRAA